MLDAFFGSVVTWIVDELFDDDHEFEAAVFVSGAIGSLNVTFDVEEYAGTPLDMASSSLEVTFFRLVKLVVRA